MTPKFKLVIFPLLLILQVVVSSLALHQNPIIDPKLESFLQNNPTADIIIFMKETTCEVLEELEDRMAKQRSFLSREDRLNSVASTLKQFTSESQKNVMSFLATNNMKKRTIYKEKEEENKLEMEIQPLWITNQIIIRNADLELVQELSALNDDIREIKGDSFYMLPTPINNSNSQNQNEGELPWGIEAINASAAWNEGILGQGIVVCTIDSGVRVTHEALRDNFVGDYGWFDPSEKTSLPNDQDGHGTHTTGTLAGTKRNIGVAPGSKWSACKVCGTGFCSQFDLLVCGQWVACPTDTNDKNPNCSRAPHLVSNSWSDGQGDSFYDCVIKAWRVAGIVPLFSIGNRGPSCGSARSPGDREGVIGVGSTNIENMVSYFSSVGPTVDDGRIKPDLVAPGEKVLSAYNASDSAYEYYSGTSMACPHTAGVVALLLSKKPDLTFDQVKEVLFAGCTPTKSQCKCGGIPDTKYPNHFAGWGQINVYNSLKFLKEKYD